MAAVAVTCCVWPKRLPFSLFPLINWWAERWRADRLKREVIRLRAMGVARLVSWLPPALRDEGVPGRESLLLELKARRDG